MFGIRCSACQQDEWHWCCWRGVQTFACVLTGSTVGRNTDHSKYLSWFYPVTAAKFREISWICSKQFLVHPLSNQYHCMSRRYPPTYPPTHPPTYLPTHSHVCLSSLCHPSNRPSIHPSIHPSNRATIHPSIHPSSRPSNLPLANRPSALVSCLRHHSAHPPINYISTHLRSLNSMRWYRRTTWIDFTMTGYIEKG